MLSYEWMGVVPYEVAFKGQKENHKNKTSVIWGLEHPLVVTVGRREVKNFNINQSAQSLQKFSFPIVETDRGGQLTLHNEGQLIIYPQFDLLKFNLGVKKYVEILLLTTESTLQLFNVNCFIDFKEGGVFTKKGKIASVGLRVQSYWVYHGLAINVKNDLSPFQFISACGVWNRPQDKMQNWNLDFIDTSIIFNTWISEFFKHLNKY